MESNRLVEVHGNIFHQACADDLGSCDNGSDKQSKEKDKETEVENGVSPDTSLAQFRLLHRINWRSNLATASMLIKAH